VEQNKKQRGQQEESEDEGAPPRPRGRAPRQQGHGRRADRALQLQGGDTQLGPRNFAGPTKKGHVPGLNRPSSDTKN
jgi:hypothetical protein